ncbi:hypothetical protein M441DRAFT_338811 [Trichoderma asperellum CBS 433.97]|uniref:Uncharacterized protein n=1 Tax=Trichoderma asperellum (strain ATCC 204424 / CBS 433.97 / NBRC 101777) TaxID=1042311 RepID=A0A2T3ZGS4_TRIA4|nr:hypothetical protein M441DRAFT_338811 [Trichoderma asperellum CBS 433.97]PTB43999.1 hypothetical protein M441DRAFT_338811 [Trichoderma asperellum CBS 433.97]
MEMYASQVLLESGKKRSHDNIEPGAAAEPAWKRPALPSGLPARCQDAEASGDIDMEESSNASVSTKSDLDCLSQRTLSQSSAGADEADIHGPFSKHFARISGSIHEFVMKHVTPRSDGSYIYASSWPPISAGIASYGTANTFQEKSIQDMRLEPSMTFFHINEMILAKKQPFTSGAVYELFARVVNFGCADFPPHYQYFQLEDLFGGMPYLSGLILRFWADRSIQQGCSIECEATQFASVTEAEGKCYCVCEPVQDSSAELGWSIYIREIRPVTWETIRSVHAHLRK